MLTEPESDPRRLELERAIIAAVTARQAAGPRPTPDADAIALRTLLAGLHPTQKAAVRAALGRTEAGLGRPLMACGGVAQLLAADRWGPFTRPMADPEQAIAAAAGGARVLVDIGPKPWWGHLLARSEVRVIAALPDDAATRPRALLISNEPTGPSGDDRTFWVTDSAMAEEAIVSALSSTGLAAAMIMQSGGLKLFMLNGYVQPQDARLRDAPGSLSGVIGAAPVF